jgi:hypothetical protein
MATVLYSYIGFADITLGHDTAVTFTDEAEIADWAKESGVAASSYCIDLAADVFAVGKTYELTMVAPGF